MKFKILTLFPNYFASPLGEGLIKKAIDKKLLEIEVFNIRDYSKFPHQSVDDTPYGGGAGMVLRADVLSEALKQTDPKEASFVILTDPAGVKLDQKLANELAKKKEITLIAGRYEGVDQRFKEKHVDLELSIGDYVLNGGEAASLVILDTIARLVPGVIGSEESLEFESFSEFEMKGKKVKLLDYPNYTKPVEFEGESVPEVLLSGDHKKIKSWREEQAIERTKKLRPDLLK